MTSLPYFSFGFGATLGCAQALLLTLCSGITCDTMGYWGSNVGQIWAEQMPYPLYYCSGPLLYLILFFYFI